MPRMQHKDVIEIIENGTAKLQTSDVLHILRNPYGWSKEQIKRAQLQACEEIENWKEAYDNLRQWCHENGLDTKTYNV